MEAALHTPLGEVALFFDGTPTSFAVSDFASDSDFEKMHPVDANKRIRWGFMADGNPHILECRFAPSVPREIGPAGGERLEAIEASDANTVVAVATEWDFEQNEIEPHGEWDYTAEIAEDGLRFAFDGHSRSREIVVGVAWLTGYVDETRTYPWLLADPGMF